MQISESGMRSDFGVAGAKPPSVRPAAVFF